MNILNKGKWNQDVGNTLWADTPVISFTQITGNQLKAQEPLEKCNRLKNTKKYFIHYNG